MDISKRSRQWKCFDFGPATKKVDLSPKEHIKENYETKITSSRKNIPVTVKKCFNFHQQLAPQLISELAVHPKKIQEVEDWFNRFVLDKKKNFFTPLLLLSGPTGSGKTSTISVICKKLNISITEWINPVDQDYEYKGMNQVEKFLEFFSESKYCSLFENTTSRISLVKDFPNAVIQNPQLFFEVLETCKYTTKQPVVFICTEASSMGLNLQRTLFPDDIMQKYNIGHISFNACASTLMKIAIKRAQELVKANSHILKQPSSQTIDVILASSSGDIRNAMNQFHVASLLGTSDIPTITTQSEKKSTKRKRSATGTTLSLMTRDLSLGLFHGLGRVLNPKRREVGNSWRLSHNIESLVDEFSTQPQMFTAFLFENYLKYFGDINDVAKAAEFLSMSVRFLENWERHETLVFALWISVLGLMIFNEHRVSRWTQIRAPSKITRNKSEKEISTVGLNVTDYFYYNMINKTDKFHRFNLDF
ncbi:unnamed protein product [Diabrotica balteata]|uniref:Cell cycle checkpoint protein RAD17 n=1 Tax=Diabrotica balteata TaxID=107213 RepID=A0A9N9TBA1_DIABA|nr:unnamed protein product [Diabrotica balteata]